MASRWLYPRLGGVYLLYFAALGMLTPYWGLYLDNRGLDAERIGWVTAALFASRIIAPYVWGEVADRSRRRMRVVRVALTVAVFAFACIPFTGSLTTLLLATAGFSFFWNAALPQIEANTLNHLGRGLARYGRIRLWGSLGFIMTVVGGGLWLDWAGPGVLPWIVLGLFGGTWLATVTAPEAPGPAAHPAESAGLWAALRRPAVLALLGATVFNQAGLGAYYGFFSLDLVQHGYARSTVGVLWAVGVVAEIGVFLVMPRLAERWSYERLLIVSLLLTIARWVMIASGIDRIINVLAAQALHLATFGLFHAACIALIHRAFPGRLQGRGQALYSSLGLGVGGAAGSLMGGYLWTEAGAPAVFWGAAVSAVLALACAVSGFAADRIHTKRTLKQ